ncbi:MAG: hypothetical protein KGZ61_10215 [Sandarakinorhabdus sp.]|nr:hypothetical protein [Sandarakinorhabdus sp.]
MTVLLAGATGLVGGRLLAGLLESGQPVISVGRRPSGAAHPQLTDLCVDFAALPPLPRADIAICALGTTMAAARSRDAFRAVDHDAVLSFLQGARRAGVQHAILITAVGSDPSAAAFYSRVKGEVERAAHAIGFERLDVIRPGLILGARADRRPIEALMQRVAPLLNPLLVGGLSDFGAIPAATIAAAIVCLCSATAKGRYIHGNRAMRRLALPDG